MAGWDWIWWSIGAAVGLPGPVLLYFGLLHDRARGRKRCPRCWYDMAGVPGLVCPECGRDARTEKRLARTRRRWPIGALGLLLTLAGAGAAGWPSIRGDGWWRLVPMDVLIRLQPAPGDEVDPVTMKMRPALLELESRVPAEAFAGRHWKAFLVNSGVLRIPRRWPADQPLVIGSRRPPISLGALLEVRATPRIKGAPPVLIGQTKPAVTRPYGAEVVGLLPPDVTSVVFDVEVLSGRLALDSWDGAPERIWRGSLRVPITLVPSIDQVMTMDPAPSTTSLVKSAVSVQYITGSASRWMSVDIGRGMLPNDLALGVRIEVLHDGVVIGGRDYPARPDPQPRGMFGSIPAPIEPSRLPDVDSAEGWTIRVTGVPELALLDFERSRCWVGEYSVPLSSVVYDLDAAMRVNRSGPITPVPAGR